MTAAAASLWVKLEPFLHTREVRCGALTTESFAYSIVLNLQFYHTGHWKFIMPNLIDFRSYSLPILLTGQAPMDSFVNKNWSIEGMDLSTTVPGSGSILVSWLFRLWSMSFIHMSGELSFPSPAFLVAYWQLWNEKDLKPFRQHNTFTRHATLLPTSSKGFKSPGMIWWVNKVEHYSTFPGDKVSACGETDTWAISYLFSLYALAHSWTALLYSPKVGDTYGLRCCL